MMNAELLDKNFGVCFPEELDGCLDVQQGSANCCKFNRWGSMIAVGSIDGRVYIFDVITKGVVKSWMCHGYPITALSWSRDGRKLLTGATDWSVAIWDVMEGTRLQRFVYGSPIISAMFNPRDEFQVLVVYLSGNPVVEDVKAKQQTEIRFDGLADDQIGDVTVATFDRRGKFIVTGSSKGRIAFYDSKSIQMITYVKQNAVHQIKNILLTRRGDFLLTNSQDRIIRTYNLTDLLSKPQGTSVEPMQKLLDIVNKENSKYIEKESEFDLEDEDADEPATHSTQVKQFNFFSDRKDEDDESVDVVTVKTNAIYCSSDEEEATNEELNSSDFVMDLTAKSGPLWFLPISPEVENPEENPLSLLYDSENGSNNHDSDYSAGIRKRTSTGSASSNGMASRMLIKQRKTK
ncbi:unnamed protein product [Anisakis simplex]|uniref:Retinoblastoma-binding protein 5 (inferred by orthology to a human protein) n=1 Tax=Anisakis simplex TaxID=6269 RepID=A0A0M3K924_ANISI|nr:unnamed protein product [Anisakis simplex]